MYNIRNGPRFNTPYMPIVPLSVSTARRRGRQDNSNEWWSWNLHAVSVSHREGTCHETETGLPKMISVQSCPFAVLCTVWRKLVQPADVHCTTWVCLLLAVVAHTISLPCKCSIASLEGGSRMGASHAHFSRWPLNLSGYSWLCWFVQMDKIIRQPWWSHQQVMLVYLEAPYFHN